jgi:hypothetical protein
MQGNVEPFFKRIHEPVCENQRNGKLRMQRHEVTHRRRNLADAE